MQKDIKIKSNTLVNNDADNSREEKESYGIDDSLRKEIGNKVLQKEKLSWSHPNFDALLSEK